MKSCALLAFLFLPGLVITAEGSSSVEEVTERLRRGEIVLLDADSSQKGGSARVQALVQAPAESVWSVITSCESSFVFVDGLKQCRVIEDQGEVALVHQVVKKGWLIPRQDFVFESLREPYHDIRFNLVEGNLKAMEGSWQFSETPDGLLVDYSIRVRPALPVPGFIVRWVMRRGMPDLIGCIRGLSGGSGSPEQQTSDLGRCRGDAKPPQ
jgi:ribosome-associated toxin RatA of RatAB toxin-antitoxin module